MVLSRLDGKRSTQPLYVSFILYRFIMLHRVKKPTTSRLCHYSLEEAEEDLIENEENEVE
ncbi:hypothetical protein LINPERHAP2_LOCUS31885, partial [Linum perenne]